MEYNDVSPGWRKETEVSCFSLKGRRKYGYVTADEDTRRWLYRPRDLSVPKREVKICYEQYHHGESLRDEIHGLFLHQSILSQV